MSRKKRPVAVSSKLFQRVGIGALAALVLALGVYGVFWHQKASEYRSKVAAANVAKLHADNAKEALRLSNLAIEDLAGQSDDGELVREGDQVKEDGFFLTRKEKEACMTCFDFKEKADSLLKTAEEERLKAVDGRDLARKGKRVWMTVGLVAIGVTGGMIVERAIGR